MISVNQSTLLPDNSKQKISQSHYYTNYLNVFSKYNDATPVLIMEIFLILIF